MVGRLGLLKPSVNNTPIEVAIIFAQNAFDFLVSLHSVSVWFHTKGHGASNVLSVNTTKGWVSCILTTSPEQPYVVCQCIHSTKVASISLWRSAPPPPGWTFLFLTILATCFVFTFTGVLQTQRNGSSNFVGTALPVTPCAVVASWTTTNRRVPHRILCHLTWHFLQRVYRSRKMPYHPFMPPQKQQILGQCFRRAGDIICM